MSLHQYLRVLRRRWRWVAGLACACTAVAAFVSFTTPPTYQATSTLFFSLQFGNSANDLAQGSTFAQNQVGSYALLATTPAVLAPVIDELDLDATVREVAAQVSTNVVPDTVVVEVSVVDSTPELASRLANAVTGQLAETAGRLAPVTADGQRTVAATTVAPATAPTAPVGPRTGLDLAIGLLAGLALGVVLAVGRDLTDTRVRTEDDLAELTDRPLLATVDNPRQQGDRRELVVVTDPRGPEAEAFRSLRTAVQFSARPGRPLSLLVTSSRPGEGKSTVAANLALTMAEAGLRVVLVDADLRRPSVATTFDLEGAAGLTNVLVGQVDVADVLQDHGSPGLDVLAAGPLPPNPSELLAAPAMAELVARLGEDHDVVLFDAPPLLPVTDAAVLARLVDQTIVVSDASRTRRGSLTQALGLLARVEGRVVGLVFTHVRRPRTDLYGYAAAPVGPQATPAGSAARAPEPVGSGRSRVQG
ncbi:polysaccharide biosynthesis tyrosine autokinase [Modestobacter roseus]|uniref:Capsular exopolysaccharide synthesis family protein n=1 Tax=Modestobacter roseus TaxID=1181884 RepID=A0A562ILD6_9ACTN|nr:polysaccharide biosynthesis tyrosine autokinase [Modestobacter roseus]MQA32811.1 polysaccharide biosynthesis tyrosine autokinase [Modestobacter roseus]TWH71545.1 capsular exopolysaccharide synthesis family protein [Modestobacter roseus]